MSPAQRPAPKRAQTRLDSYAPSQIGREHSLKPNERLVLLTMALVVDYRTGEWHGTLLELHDDTGVSRDTLPKVVRRLIESGLLLELEPFARNGAGRFRILCLEQLLVLTELVAQRLRDRYAVNMSAICRSFVGIPTYQQDEEAISKEQGNKGQGREALLTDEESETQIAPKIAFTLDVDSVVACLRCGEPCDDSHPFSHEAMPPAPEVVPSVPRATWNAIGERVALLELDSPARHRLEERGFLAGSDLSPDELAEVLAILDDTGKRETMNDYRPTLGSFRKQPQAVPLPPPPSMLSAACGLVTTVLTKRDNEEPLPIGQLCFEMAADTDLTAMVDLVCRLVIWTPGARDVLQTIALDAAGEQ